MFVLVANLRKFFTDCFQFCRNVAFNYAHVFIYLLYKNVPPVTGKNIFFLNSTSVGRKSNKRYTKYFTIPFQCFQFSNFQFYNYI